MLKLGYIVAVLGVGMCFTGLRAQETEQHTLAFYLDVMINAGQAQHREVAHQAVYQRLRKILEKPDARTMQFDSLAGIQVVAPEDSTFRLFTWQLRTSDSTFHYYGFIQPLTDSLPFVELKDTRSLRSEYSGYDQDTWYGALYYGITTFHTATGEPRYLVLGFNAHNARTNIKVADVLYYSSSGVRFGDQSFIQSDSSGTDIKSRVILEYADAAAGRMQFDRQRGILAFDHVITIFTDGPEAGPLQVPDGSYHGYQLEEGRWHFIEKLFTTTVDEPPGDDKEEDPVKRDLFGRPVKDK
jgi:hypothetical protein